MLVVVPFLWPFILIQFIRVRAHPETHTHTHRDWRTHYTLTHAHTPIPKTRRRGFGGAANRAAAHALRNVTPAAVTPFDRLPGPRCTAVRQTCAPCRGARRAERRNVRGVCVCDRRGIESGVARPIAKRIAYSERRGVRNIPQIAFEIRLCGQSMHAVCVSTTGRCAGPLSRKSLVLSLWIIRDYN